jgi:hypothetical protein
MKLFFVCLVFGFVSCSTIQYSNKSDYNQAAGELNDISKDDNLTPEQKVIIKHASTKLQAVEKIVKENEKLQQELVKESKQAGAGRMAYSVLIFLCLVVTAFIIKKMMGVFT